MSGAYHKFPCTVCGRHISDAGFARASHAKAHAKQGLYEARTFQRLPWKAAVALIEAAEVYAYAIDAERDADKALEAAIATSSARVSPWLAERCRETFREMSLAQDVYDDVCFRVAEDVIRIGGLTQAYTGARGWTA